MSRNKGGENGGKRIRKKARSPLLEIAVVLVRFDHVASVIVNADYRIM